MNGPRNPVRDAEPDSTVASIVDFLDQWRTAWNDRDAGRILELVADDIVWVDNTWPRPLHGRRAVRGFLNSFFRRMRVTFDVVAGPYVLPNGSGAAVHWRARGTVTGTPFESDGADFYELAGGRLCRFHSITATLVAEGNEAPDHD